MAPRPRCPICRSRQWHKEPSSGLIACSEGHILENYRKESNDAEDLGHHGLKKRTIKSRRQKKGKTSRANPQLYHGERGRFLYFQCLQWIFRKQIASLTLAWNLPPEFESICRDIWALHLSLLPSPPPAEPYYHTHGDGTLKNDTQDHDDSYSSSSEDEDPELADLLRQNSDLSSTSEEEAGVEETVPVTRMRKKRAEHRFETPLSTIAVLVVALWTLRVPVLYRDLIRLIETYQLLYLDPARTLPEAMLVHLTKHNIQALSPFHAPDPISLHTEASRLAKKLRETYAIETPEANIAPILWRVIRCFGANSTLYILVKRLSAILSPSMALHNSLTPGFQHNADLDSHKYDNIPPEIALMGVSVIVLKMVYGLDDRTRSPMDESDPALILPNKCELLKLIREMHLAERDLHTSTPADQLSPDGVDEYISFCEQALLGHEQKQHKLLTSYFPVGQKRDPVDATILADRSDRQLAANVLTEEELRVGDCYAIYHSRDVLGNIPEELELVLERGSRWAGIEVEYLSGVVEKYERRLMKLR